MPVVPLTEIVGRSFAERYGVPAVNIFNDLTLEAVLAGAVQAQSPVIVQTSVKTVRSLGASFIKAMWDDLTRDIPVPVSLHLDHCPDRDVITTCLQHGWNSVLFDASELPVEENQRQTIEVVAEARRFGAHVEGEIESIQGVEDDHGSDEESRRQSLEVQLAFLEATGVDVFAPAIGNAHGAYKSTPVLDGERITQIVESHPVPIALHGGSGLSDDQFRDLIARGCAKVNISTALKERFMRAELDFLTRAQAAGTWDPPSLFRHTRQEVVDLVVGLCDTFGSAGKA
ncbi:MULTISPECIES: class II fructose-bisphosphate aldolase [Microbacterium]|uniref:Class II fructose-bisphosphate aldolase n=1 Tax=Microbacterium wangchenii TaxID=2541726 RepID=A0ABX5SYJ4_9MICO|nr:MULTISPECIES: class II fructose-bisphosphate aldolase [Microbacterium]MCK6066017.1 class II fructose-bisphosphate aldolase [Microbacterium sp. EYE_512]QBR90306.1 class II fructose-bisphosphate aldolase [Microbacterium wangchenii]